MSAIDLKALGAFDGVDDAIAEDVLLETPEWEDSRPWPTLDPIALHGLAGDFVRAVAPHSEPQRK